MARANFFSVIYSIRIKTCNKLMCFLFLALVISSSLTVQAQIPQYTSKSLAKPNLWQNKDLMQPAALASILTNKNSKRPVILNIGVVEDIEGAKNIGAASKAEYLEKLRRTLKELPKNTAVVIYCGCCPFEKCPNIRPAYSMMKEMGFVNGKLLNIPVNLKQDWINKGYPMALSIK